MGERKKERERVWRSERWSQGGVLRLHTRKRVIRQLEGRGRGRLDSCPEVMIVIPTGNLAPPGRP